MDKLTYFIKSINDETYLNRAWVYRCFSIAFREKEESECLPSFNPEDGWSFEGEAITGWQEGQCLFPIKERIRLKVGDIPGMTQDTETNYGEVIIYAMLFIFSCNGKIPFKAGKINKDYLNKSISLALEDAIITTDEYLSIVKGLNQITLFSDLHVSAYTPRSMVPSKEVLALRDELLEKYKDKLNDPAVIAIIDEAITSAIKDYMKGDASEKFYLKDKAYSVVLKKLFYLQGGVDSLENPGQMDYLKGSLDEGYTVEDLPVINNQLRGGSYDRGISTALGGEAAKFSNRVFQNLKIADEDCGTMVGKPELITGRWNFVGRYLVGKDTPLTEKDLKRLMGKEVILRDPTACKTVNGNFCYRCMGEGQRKAKLGLGPRLAEICSVFLSVSLAAFHGRSSKTTMFDPNRDLM